MRFAPSEEQVAFADAVRSVLDKECGPGVVRAAWDHHEVLDRGVWDSLAEMGVPWLLVPEADGGLGLDAEFLVPVLEECGRAALPHPVLETALVAAPLAPRHIGSSLVASDLGGPILANALDADLFLVHDTDGLHLLERSAVELDAVETVDGARRAARVTTFTSEGPIGTQADVDAAFLRGALGASALLVGLAEQILSMTVDYVKERHQFGVPVGSFQALKHQLADALKDLSFARPVLRRAANSLATTTTTVERDIAMAKTMTTHAAEHVGRVALQAHGAIGYTVEHDLHLYLKRIWALSRTWGTPTHHRHRVAHHLGLTPT